MASAPTTSAAVSPPSRWGFCLSCANLSGNFSAFYRAPVLTSGGGGYASDDGCSDGFVAVSQ